MREVSVPGSILIVDDEQAVRELLKIALRPLNHPVREAGDGVEALEQVSQQVPALMILDLMMPRLDGVSVLRSLRENPETRSLPVLLFSAYQLSRDEKNEFGVEPWMVISKGRLSIKELRETVSFALQGNGSPPFVTRPAAASR